MENKQNNTKDREIFLSRILNAPVELVWEVWTKPEHIAKWWGPNGFTNTINIMEVKPGGEWILIMHSPDGTNYDNSNIFREISENQKLVFDHVSDPRSTTTVEFTARGEQTFLTWHMVFKSAEVFQELVTKYGAAEGMKENFTRLEKYIEGKK